MKKISAFLFLFLSFFSYSEVPEAFKGIWKADDRIIFFGEDESQFSVVLKTFNGWYYDLAAIPESEKSNAREKNDSISSNPETINVSFTQLFEALPVYELTLNFDSKNKKIIPCTVSGNKLYLNFLVRNEIPDNKESLNGFWQGFNYAENIRISDFSGASQILSWYVEDSAVYQLRFWKTKADYDENAQASFTDGEISRSVNKFIYSAGENFTCVQGRGNRIRNINKFSSLPLTFSADETGRILLLDKPAFTKADETSYDELKEIIKEANSRFAPLWPDPFPEEELDWHYDIINNLEKDNQIIQNVRQRQNQFGPRGKETNK